jgi:sec-independent protein translocase protein TatA
MLGTLGLPEIAIIAAVVVVLFGAGRLSSAGKDLGTAIREFRRAMKEPPDDPMEGEPHSPPPTAPAGTVPTPADLEKDTEQETTRPTLF